MRTKAEFRAMRESLGLTQQRLADDLGVKILSVKRWESPNKPQNAPDGVWEFLDDLMEAQDVDVAAILAKAQRAGTDQDEGQRTYELPCWMSQADYASCHDELDDQSWTEANATARRAAVMLRWLGYDVRWTDALGDE